MTHYEILGVRKTASTDEIKNAYKKLVKKYHPDVYVGDKSFAEKKIKEINEAYDVLSNPEQKREYDESIAPQTYTTYDPQNYNSYTYSNPKYSASAYTYKTTSKRNAQAKDSKYSYENYRKTYNSTNYGSYDYQKRYTDYHRSKTPNSSYSNNKTPDYAEKAVNTFFNFSNTSKSLILVLIVIFFIIFFIINTLQITSLLGKEPYSRPGSHYTDPSPSTSSDSQTSIITGDTYETRNPYLEPEEDSSSDYTVTSPEIPSLNDFDINDVFSDAEIMDAYLAYEGDLYTTFESFKEALRVAYYNAYILPYIYSY